MTALDVYDDLVPAPLEHNTKLRGSINPIIFGNLELRMAKDVNDLEAAQNLRYRVFYEELGALPSLRTKNSRLDYDKFDDYAEHILVIDRTSRSKPNGIDHYPVIGTYRLLQISQMDNKKTFYTSTEYDISKLLSFPGKILELGRSCVDIRYRNRATMQLLWHGIASYVFNFDIDLMFGCASFPGACPNKHLTALSYLQSHYRAPESLCPRALPNKYINMAENKNASEDTISTMNSLPPLIKGYLRVGGWVGDGAVIDNQFNTTDVCIVLKTGSLPRRYYKHYQRSLCKRT